MVLALVAVGAYAWDASKDGEIAEGVRIGSTDVAGMTESEARIEVRKELIQPLDKPVTVTDGQTRYVLSPERLGVRADIDGMVDEALAAGREQSLPTRVWRYATGGEVDERIRPRIVYSEQSLDEFVKKIAADVNSPPTDASIEASPSSLNTVAGSNGTALHAEELRDDLEVAVQSPGRRTVEAEVETVQPEVTTAELAERYPTYLTVDRSSFELRLWEGLELTSTYTIAVGAAGFDTPAGVYEIQNKAVDPAWSMPDSDWAGDLAGQVVPGGTAENPLKARWMGIFDGAGIHGTDDVGSLGSAASHGCVRMAVPDVIELYDQVPVGTPIYIG